MWILKPISLQFIKLGLITTMAITLSNNNYGIKTAVAEIKETISNLLIPVRYTFKSVV